MSLRLVVDEVDDDVRVKSIELDHLSHLEKKLSNQNNPNNPKLLNLNSNVETVTLDLDTKRAL